MPRRRTATGAALVASLALLALLGAACAGTRATNVAAGSATQGTSLATSAIESTTTSVTTPPDRTAGSADPAEVTTIVKPGAQPEPASIEVDYEPHDGASATATITGPNGSHAKSLDNGSALFSRLPPGTYSVTITIDTPSGDPTIGDARQIINGGNVQVDAGEHGVIHCDDTGCSPPV